MKGWSLILLSSTLSAAFDRVSHSSLLFKSESIGVGGNVLSICRDSSPTGATDGATSEWIPSVSGVPRGNVLSPRLLILYTSEMFELVENRLFAYVDDSTLLAVARMPADRPAVAASLNRDLARIQERCNHWCA